MLVRARRIHPSRIHQATANRGAVRLTLWARGRQGVHAILNASMRPAMKKFLCGAGGGSAAGLAACAECIAQEDDEECTIED